MRNLPIRRIHRWVAIAFTLSVAANFVAFLWGRPPAWITYAPLPPLLFLALTGLYMFALPLAGNWRTQRSPRTEG